MKALLLAIALVSVSATAKADGFRCTSDSTSLNVKIYNEVQPSAGTRNGAVMVLSNPEISFPNKTVATFTSAKGTLENSGSKYTGKVDLRVSESSRAGEFIGKTRLGMLKNVVVALSFNASKPVPAGASVLGWVTLNRRDGNKETYRLNCTRYLKGN